MGNGGGEGEWGMGEKGMGKAEGEWEKAEGRALLSPASLPSRDARQMQGWTSSASRWLTVERWRLHTGGSNMQLSHLLVRGTVLCSGSSPHPHSKRSKHSSYPHSKRSKHTANNSKQLVQQTVARPHPYRHSFALFLALLLFRGLAFVERRREGVLGLQLA